MKTVFTLLLSWMFVSAAAQTTAINYIDKHKDDAIEQMNKYGVPASIILGIAMHESANGTSKIARYLNNHFGIKGDNSSKKIKSAYKGYKTVEDSYKGFIQILKSRSKFSSLFDKFSAYDYRSWVLGIQQGGYAVSKTWANQVLATIKKYKLYQYDNIPVKHSQAINNKPAKIEKILISNTYTVKKGDTLFIIAKKFGTTVKALMHTNFLKSTLLEPGQKLKI